MEIGLDKWWQNILTACQIDPTRPMETDAYTSYETFMKCRVGFSRLGPNFRQAAVNIHEALHGAGAAVLCAGANPDSQWFPGFQGQHISTLNLKVGSLYQGVSP